MLEVGWVVPFIPCVDALDSVVLGVDGLGAPSLYMPSSNAGFYQYDTTPIPNNIKIHARMHKHVSLCFGIRASSSTIPHPHRSSQADRQALAINVANAARATEATETPGGPGHNSASGALGDLGTGSGGADDLLQDEDFSRYILGQGADDVGGLGLGLGLGSVGGDDMELVGGSGTPPAPLMDDGVDDYDPENPL